MVSSLRSIFIASVPSAWLQGYVVRVGVHNCVARYPPPPQVDWTNLGIEPGLSALAEPYGTSSPCSGFVVEDDNGIPCAGFRECSGNWPGRTNTQV